jgi:hypothetical protein
MAMTEEQVTAFAELTGRQASERFRFAQRYSDEHEAMTARHREESSALAATLGLPDPNPTPMRLNGPHRNT